MGENHKTVITFDLQLYEKAVKLQMHKAPDLDLDLGFPNWRDAHDNGFFARSWGINRWQWL